MAAAEGRRSLIKKSKWLATGALVAGANVFSRFDPKSAITVVADPRGGSTWLFEVLQGIRGVATVYEPLHLQNVPRLRSLGIGWEQHIPENESWPEVMRFFEDIYEGKVLNRFTCSYSNPLDYYRAERLLVKFVRAKLLLPWLLNRFRFDLKPLVLTRHPMAVAASMMRHGGWQHAPAAFPIPEERFAEFFEPHRARLAAVSTVEERHVAKWCLANQYLLQHAGNNRDWITIHYEHLVLAPQAVLAHVFDAWGMQMPRRIVDRLDIRSRTTVDLAGDKSEQVQKWRHRFDSETRRKLLDLMDYFEVDLYGAGGLPNPRSPAAGFVPGQFVG
ncbi:sulfotransferase domain-containing protein [Pelagibius sp.]|uniref:sulfotransferase domain-containing protein n=1 Tax=Pelagibius sp. TaxID=1931238 RepID=UPI00261C149E|nr:sulfotransferase domain-containing protein [Pelagibius sp.]